MIILQAPHNLIQATIALPSPDFGDYISPQVKVNIRNSEDGVIYSTVKTAERDKLEFELDLTPSKARELEAFVNAYNAMLWRLTTHLEEVYYVHLLTNPVEFSQLSRNTVSVHLEFEGTKVA